MDDIILDIVCKPCTLGRLGRSCTPCTPNWSRISGRLCKPAVCLELVEGYKRLEEKLSGSTNEECPTIEGINGWSPGGVDDIDGSDLMSVGVDSVAGDSPVIGDELVGLSSRFR